MNLSSTEVDLKRVNERLCCASLSHVLKISKWNEVLLYFEGWRLISVGNTNPNPANENF